jgi:hypothetical protein
MSTLNLMEEHLNLLLDKATNTLRDEGLLVPVAIALTAESEIVTISFDKFLAVHDKRLWADLIRHTLAESDAQCYVIIAERCVRRKKPLSNEAEGRGQGRRHHCTGISPEWGEHCKDDLFLS